MRRRPIGYRSVRTALHPVECSPQQIATTSLPSARRWQKAYSRVPGAGSRDHAEHLGNTRSLFTDQFSFLFEFRGFWREQRSENAM